MSTPTTPEETIMHAATDPTTGTPTLAAATGGATVPATRTPGPVGPSGRLRNGELRRQVAVYLADGAGGAYTAGEIARALAGRSAGAVANALQVLASRGEAVVVGTGPTRYGPTPSTTSAATGTTPGGTASGPAVSGTPGPGGPTTPRARRGPTPGSAATVTAGPGAVATSGTGAVEEPVSGPVPRPNGQLYHPRLVAGMPDVTALRKLRAAGVPALLYGPPGTGKTSVVEAAFGDLITVPGDGDTTVADIVGEYTQTPEGRYVFVHGPLVRAMREGRCLFVDDATLIPPNVLATLYPAMDGRRQVIVKANGGEVVDAAAGFYVVAGHNPGVHGAVLTDALSSRFSAQIQVSSDYDLATQLKIDRRAVRAARNLATRQRRGEVGWAPQLRELIAFSKIAKVLGVEAAAGNLVGVAPEEDRDTVATVVRDAFGAEHTPLSLGPRI
ncbi:AAA family ATPase [Pseudonocardia sichuanensis]|uniref:Dynein-related subfamily AAA family protein n=1 Tax=Pseudonocardia kunmingensis TaxID=630975 RepID=A0A543D9J0_9PSEU|nr:AAA family ATPase [Pseudonocardia kunmingensis]TQM06007.1 dynein-related subfamily AAA family protein [Pseudonocardia kunmingensis]